AFDRVLLGRCRHRIERNLDLPPGVAPRLIPHYFVSRRPTRSADTECLAVPVEELLNLPLGHRHEVRVPRADRIKWFGGQRADDVIGGIAKARAAVGRGRRHCGDQLSSAAGSQKRQSPAHAGAGGQSIVHDEHRSPVDLHWIPAVAKIRGLPFEFLLRLAGDSFHEVLRQAQAADHLSVKFVGVSRGGQAHGHLLVTGREQLAQHQNIQGRAQRLRDFISRGHPAVRKAKYRQVRFAGKTRQFRGERPAAFVTILILWGDAQAGFASRWRCELNQPAAMRETRSSAPSSSNKCVAPGMSCSNFSPCRRANACSFNSITGVSLPPTIRSVAAVTSSSDEPARSGRPPRDTTAATRSRSSPAATSAAAAPVLEPKYPICKSLTEACCRSHRVAAMRREASKGMLKRRCPVYSSTSSSPVVRRSNSRVPRPASCSTRATYWLRGLWRLLPLPCANSTTPWPSGGRVNSPSKCARSTGIMTSHASKRMVSLIRVGPASNLPPRNGLCQSRLTQLGAICHSRKPGLVSCYRNQPIASGGGAGRQKKQGEVNEVLDGSLPFVSGTALAERLRSGARAAGTASTPG